MREIKEGSTFFVCSRETLLEKGWKYDHGDFWHSEYPGNGITDIMLKNYEFKILTVKGPVIYLLSLYRHQKGWYLVEENTYYWPVSTFFADETEHICIEGMTPIDGWFICKTCGTNLKEIK